MYLYTYRPKLGVTLSGQEEVLREVFGDLGHGRSDRSPGGSQCTQFSSLVIEVRRHERPRLLPVVISLFVVVVVEEFSYMRESEE